MSRAMENKDDENDVPKDSNDDVHSSVLCSDNNSERRMNIMNLISQNSNTLLLESILDGDVTYMRSLMTTGANLNATCHLDRVTACHIAALQDNDTLHLLVSSGADTSRTDQHGRTPLHLAAWAGNVKQIAVLLNFPKELRNSLVDHVKLSPETMAEVTRHSLPVNKLTNLPCRRNVDCTRPGDWSNGADNYWPRLKKMLPKFQEEGWTALHVASARAHHHCVQLLLAAGADVSVLDNRYRTPLDVAGCAHSIHWTDENNFMETVNILKAGMLKSGGQFSNYGDSDKCFTTPLHTAVLLGREAAARQLLDAGASATAWNKDGQTAMHMCVKKRNKELLLILASHESSNKGSNIAAIDVVDMSGETVLCAAIYEDWVEGVRIALNAGATNLKAIPRELSKNESTVFHLAAYLGNEDILNHLLNFCNHEEIKKHINTPHDSFGLPLYNAVGHNKYDSASLLITRGAKVNIKDWDYYTLLNLAVQNNNTKMAEMILQNDDLSDLDQVGALPMYTACCNGNKEMIALLLRNGGDLSGKDNELPIKMLMMNVSKPTKFLQEIFDSKIIRIGQEAEDKFSVEVNFGVLVPRCGRKNMKMIQALLDTGNTYDQHSLLLHPLVESFLYLQWRSLLPFFYIILALHVCFVLSINVFALSLFWYTDRKIESVPIIFRSSAWVYIIYLTAFLLIIQEVIVIKIKTMKDFLTLEVSVKWLSTIFAVVLPQVVSWDSKSHPEWVRLFGSATLLLTWVRVMYLLSRLPGYGYYVLMYGKVATKVFKILVSLGFLIVGFCVSFMIQFHAQRPFEDPISSLLTTMVMMSSELGYNEIINKKSDEDASSPSLTMIRLIFVPFLILVSIILMNLLVGVAVNDVNTLEIIGNINRLKKQVQFIKSFEDAGSYNFIKRILERWFDEPLESKYKDWNCLHTLQDYGLSARLIETLFENAQLQKWQSDEKQSTELFQAKLDEVHDIIVNKNTFVPTKPDTTDNEVKVLVSQVLEEIVKLRTEIELNKNCIGKIADALGLGPVEN